MASRTPSRSAGSSAGLRGSGSVLLAPPRVGRGDWLQRGTRQPDWRPLLGPDPQSSPGRLRPPA
eukprot:13874296-Alexandrium_andersonii.AAC.1